MPTHPDTDPAERVNLRKAWQPPRLRKIGTARDIAMQGAGTEQGNGRRGIVLS